VDKPEISEIDKISRQIGQDEDRVHLMYGIREKDQTAYQAEVPEGNRNDTLFSLFGGDPLDQKPHGEHRLADKSEDEPEIDPKFGVLLGKV
jgi:hypothetical protein